ncbi:hypothetical protein NHJ13051_000654 [Beauveria bassiana]
MAPITGPLFPYRDINLRVSNDAYTFTSPSSPNAPALVLDRPTGDVSLTEPSLQTSKRATRVSSIAGILGVIQLKLDKYVVIINKTKPVGRLKGQMVYKVLAAEILPMRERQIHDPDEDTFVRLLDTFLQKAPLYFSYSLDLTNSFQRQSQADTTKPLWMRADDRFFYNRFLQSDLVDFRNLGSRAQPGAQPAIDPYILPCMFGMFETKQTKFKGTPLSLTLISRRSRYRGGTRFFTRGVDEDGHVANYNETEQIVILNEASTGMGGFVGSTDMQSGKLGGTDGKDMQIMSYVQTRGSVPTYWAEINSLRYTPKLQVRSTEAATAPAARHFDEQIRIYGDNYLINLVNSKGRERNVKESYEKMCESLSRAGSVADVTNEKFTVTPSSNSRNHFDRIHYVYFDFHTETKGMRMDKAYNLVTRMHEELEKQSYFRGVDMPGGLDDKLEARSLQTSVMRTNCMDCLDRTNVVQSMFARAVLDRIFSELGLMPRGASFRDEDPDFEFLFRNLWADNADIVSGSYSGTGAMKTDVTRTGKRTKLGALQDGRIGITRYFLNNFLDGPRQDSFDLFLGAYQPGKSGVGLGRIFVDRRPILIQSIPYLLAFSTFIVLIGIFTKREPDARVLPMRLFILVWTAVAAWCMHFILGHGMLYVNWPILNPRPFASEGYNEHYSKARKDALLGSFVARHERGLSTARFLSAEEGKKRIE